MEASDEKVKRFRLHVVKELYETEKDYTESLEFTVEVGYEQDWQWESQLLYN